LTDPEIVKLWNATDKIPLQFGAVLKLLLLTGCRAAEVDAMRWAELGDDGIWTIPGSRTKNHLEHIVPLSALARNIIESVPRIEGDFVFSTTGRSAISGWSKIKKRLDKEMSDVPHWRRHDLRRTASTNMNALSILPHVVEAVLNHVSGHKGGVAGTYNKYNYLPEKREALARWSRHVQGLVADKGKVVPLERQRRKRVSS
jgi:integrase